MTKKIYFNTFEELKSYWKNNKEKVIEKGHDSFYYVIVAI